MSDDILADGFLDGNCWAASRDVVGKIIPARLNSHPGHAWEDLDWGVADEIRGIFGQGFPGWKKRFHGVADLGDAGYSREVGSSRDDFVKYPRTPHLFGSKGTDDDKHLGRRESE